MSRDRSRDRSRSLSRDDLRRFSSDTSSDDPKAVMSRIFIGNLPTDRVNRDDVDEAFRKYGPIRAISMLKGFGFVQFEREESARKAVASENYSFMRGNRLDVKMAFEGMRGGGRGGVRRRPSPPYRGGRGRSPPRRDSMDRMRDRRGSYHRDDHPMGFHSRGHYDGGDFLMQQPRDIGMRKRQELTPEAIVDCEIICLTNSRPLRSYADFLVDKLRTMKIVARIKILPLDDQLSYALDECIKRCMLYAIVVNDDHEVHRSITLNVLHGTPQEHRNMPLDQAMKFVKSNFEEHTEALKQRLGKSTAPAVPSSPQEFLAPDQNTTYLFNLLGDGRFLSLEELNQVIDYLTTRRDRLMEVQGLVPPQKAVAATVPTKECKDIVDQQKELQSKILSILSGEGESSEQGSSASYAPVEVASPPTSVIENVINFDNPNVKKALDSLIANGSLMKNLSAVSPTGESQMSYQSNERNYRDRSPLYDDAPRYGY